MIVLCILALVALTIIIERSLFYWRTKYARVETLQDFIKKERITAGFLPAEKQMERLTEAVQIYINKMERGMVLLNGIGNLAPLVGFFGTVIGMIDAFSAIASAATVNAKVVAVGIQIALVTTAGGLAVAVPTLGFYHFFNHLIQNIYAAADEILFREEQSSVAPSNDVEEATPQSPSE